jgi:hypothetical protein
MDLEFYTENNFKDNENNSELSIYVKTWDHYKVILFTILILIFRKRIMIFFYYIYEFFTFKKVINEMELSLSEVINCNTNLQNKYNKQIKSYNKISGKFPHLSFEQVIKFDEKLRNNGGSLLCHNGNFIDCMFPACCYARDSQREKKMGFYIKCWDCCPLYKPYTNGTQGGPPVFKTLFKPKKMIKNNHQWLKEKGGFNHDYQNFDYTREFIKSITKDGLLSYSGDFEDDKITVIYNFHMSRWGIPTHKSYDEVLTKKGKQLRETGALDYLKCQETMQNPMPDSYCFCGGKEFSIKEFL